MESSHEKFFLHHYQKLLFSDQNMDPHETASIRRKCMGLMFKASIPLTNNITTCSLYERDLKSYTDIVDDKNGINNYAENIEDLLACKQTECDKWKSSLKAEDHKRIFQCESYNVINEDIEFLKNEFQAEKAKKNCAVNSTINKGPSTSATDDDHKNVFSLGSKEKKESLISRSFSFKNTDNQALNGMPFGKSNEITSNINYPGVISNCSDNIKLPGICKMDVDDSFKPAFSNVVSYNTLRHGNPYERSSSFPSNSHSSNESSKSVHKPSIGFVSAREELGLQNKKKWGVKNSNCGPDSGIQKKSLGNTRRSVTNKFIPPMRSSEEESGGMMNRLEFSKANDMIEDERLRNIDPKMIDLIRSEIMDSGAAVHWDDIAGLQFAKTTIQEIVVWPMLRPEIFTGLRRPPKGILLFGPPGTGKTLIGKCIASQSLSTFFSISASSLTSKWIGDGEKMVRALFAVARCHQPAVIFIDEIDSLLTQRSDTEHESSRRIKTEFLVQLDGATTGEEDRILVVGATNRPQELDEAARRRLVKRLYIPLPDHDARCQIVQRLMSKENNCLTKDQINEIGCLTDGYSGADVKNVCQEASLGPIRSINFMDIQSISPDEVRPINFEDFQSALKRVRASVSSCDLDSYLKWDKTYGSG